MNMKHLLNKISSMLLLAVVCVLNGHAQNGTFAPVGAQWYYETQSMFTSGYIMMEAEKDTVVDGFACVKLRVETHFHNLEFGVLQEGVLPPVYLSQLEDSVMVYQGNAFHKLFDFGAEIGDTWTVAGREGLCEEDEGTVRVVDKGVEDVNGVPLKYVTIKDETDSYWGFGFTMYGSPSPAVKVLERIGPIGSYLLPEQRCLFDYAEGGTLRCYIDDELGELHLSSLHPERNCDYISETYQSADEISFDAALSVFPSPTDGRFTVWGKDLSRAEVFNALGQHVASASGQGERLVIRLDGQPAGIYFIEVTDTQGRRCVKKVVKQ